MKTKRCTGSCKASSRGKCAPHFLRSRASSRTRFALSSIALSVSSRLCLNSRKELSILSALLIPAPRPESVPIKGSQWRDRLCPLLHRLGEREVGRVRLGSGEGNRAERVEGGAGFKADFWLCKVSLRSGRAVLCLQTEQEPSCGNIFLYLQLLIGLSGHSELVRPLGRAFEDLNWLLRLGNLPEKQQSGLNSLGISCECLKLRSEAN